MFILTIQFRSAGESALWRPSTNAKQCRAIFLRPPTNEQIVCYATESSGTNCARFIARPRRDYKQQRQIIIHSTDRARARAIVWSISGADRLPRRSDEHSRDVQEASLRGTRETAEMENYVWCVRVFASSACMRLCEKIENEWERKRERGRHVAEKEMRRKKEERRGVRGKEFVTSCNMNLKCNWKLYNVA